MEILSVFVFGGRRVLVLEEELITGIGMAGDALDSFNLDAPRHTGQGRSECLRLSSMTYVTGGFHNALDFHIFFHRELDY